MNSQEFNLEIARTAFFVDQLRGVIQDPVWHAEVIIHFIDRDRDTCLWQNKNRATAIPESEIDRMAEHMEFPDETECHNLLHHV